MIRDLEKPTVAIVHFTEKFPDEFPAWQRPRRVHYQVTLDPSKIEQTKYFIRLGETAGDEITGWQPIDSLEVDVVLGELREGKVYPLEAHAVHASAA